MRYPEFLKPGGTIGFVAPSFGCATEPYMTCFNAGLKRLNEMGYETVLGPNCRESKGIGKSNTPELCGAEVNEFFLNNNCDVIFSVGGGETMCEDLPFFDLEGIKKAAPKWYMGYSDNTNLTFILPTLCDTAAVYGPCAAEFGMEPLHPAVLDAFSLVEGKKLTFNNYDGWESEQLKSEEQPLLPYNINEPYAQIVAGNKELAKEFSGRFIGGCLDILVQFPGTPFDGVKAFNERYKEEGIIWFIESCDLNVMSVRRALWQLDQAGWFEHVKGFLVGRPVNYADEFLGYGMHDAVTDMLSKFNVPIIMDIDLGHMSPQMPFISGGYGTVRTTEKTIAIEYELR
ncbi:MAG: LD-carboxypeptidase [Lachnospiraceae bacterium]|nr:LD-carboxypeptidase [Lachnospiraceae bacterium]